VEKEIEGLSLQQYLDIYKKPLSQPAIVAVKKLTEVAQMKKKKKKKKQKVAAKTKKKKNLASSSSIPAGEQDATA
jgi:hypothetical protein